MREADTLRGLVRQGPRCQASPAARVRGLASERGQTLVMAALLMPLVLGMVGLAVDVGLLFIAKRQVQIAADSAAMAGAAELNYGDYTSAAQSISAKNGFTDGVNGVTVSVNPSGTTTPSPLYGAYKGKSGYLEVVVSAAEPTYFMRIFNVRSMTVSARSVGAMGKSGNCIYMLATSGTTLFMDNGAKMSAPSCGFLDDSSSSTALSVSGGAILTASSVGVVGNATTYVSGSPGTISPSPVTGIGAFSDPLAYVSPPSYDSSSCGPDPQSHYGNGVTSYTVGPGSNYSTTQAGNVVCYTSLTLGDNSLKPTLNPGTYVITGGLTFSSGGTTLGGSGVTFYLVGNSALNINNGTTMTLSAPTSGTYNGLLFYQDRSDTQAASIQGGSTTSLTGIFYFPKAALTVGNGSSTTFTSPIVAQSLTMMGGSTFTDNDYNAVNASSPLTTPGLVE